MTVYLLIYCTKDKELENETKMNDLRTSKDLETIIRKWGQRQIILYTSLGSKE